MAGSAKKRVKTDHVVSSSECSAGFLTCPACFVLVAPIGFAWHKSRCPALCSSQAPQSTAPLPCVKTEGCSGSELADRNAHTGLEESVAQSADCNGHTRPEESVAKSVTAGLAAFPDKPRPHCGEGDPPYPGAIAPELNADLPNMNEAHNSRVRQLELQVQDLQKQLALSKKAENRASCLVRLLTAQLQELQKNSEGGSLKHPDVINLVESSDGPGCKSVTDSPKDLGFVKDLDFVVALACGEIGNDTPAVESMSKKLSFSHQPCKHELMPMHADFSRHLKSENFAPDSTVQRLENADSRSAHKPWNQREIAGSSQIHGDKVGHSTPDRVESDAKVVIETRPNDIRHLLSLDDQPSSNRQLIQIDVGLNTPMSILFGKAVESVVSLQQSFLEGTGCPDIMEAHMECVNKRKSVMLESEHQTSPEIELLEDSLSERWNGNKLCTFRSMINDKANSTCRTRKLGDRHANVMKSDSESEHGSGSWCGKGVLTKDTHQSTSPGRMTFNDGLEMRDGVLDDTQVSNENQAYISHSTASDESDSVCKIGRSVHRRLVMSDSESENKSKRSPIILRRNSHPLSPRLVEIAQACNASWDLTRSTVESLQRELCEAQISHSGSPAASQKPTADDNLIEVSGRDDCIRTKPFGLSVNHEDGDSACMQRRRLKKQSSKKSSDKLQIELSDLSRRAEQNDAPVSVKECRLDGQGKESAGLRRSNRLKALVIECNDNSFLNRRSLTSKVGKNISEDEAHCNQESQPDSENHESRLECGKPEAESHSLEIAEQRPSNSSDSTSIRKLIERSGSSRTKRQLFGEFLQTESRTWLKRAGVCEGEEGDEDSDSSEDSSLSGFIVDGSSDSSGSSPASGEGSMSESHDEEDSVEQPQSSCSDDDSSSSEGSQNFRRAKELKCKNYSWDFEADMLSVLDVDIVLCLRAICALYRQQTEDEQREKSCKYTNKRGFDRIHAIRGSRIAKFLTDGDPTGPIKKSVSDFEQFDPTGLEFCKKLAFKHSRQLFEIYKCGEDPFPYQ